MVSNTEINEIFCYFFYIHNSTKIMYFSIFNHFYSIFHFVGIPKTLDFQLYSACPIRLHRILEKPDGRI